MVLVQHVEHSLSLAQFRRQRGTLSTVTQLDPALHAGQQFPVMPPGDMEQYESDGAQTVTPPTFP